MDLVQRHPKTPPAPPNVDYVFFSHHCFIVLFQCLGIIFTLKVIKKREKWTQPETPPPPLWIKSIQMFFFTSIK